MVIWTGSPWELRCDPARFMAVASARLRRAGCDPARSGRGRNLPWRAACDPLVLRRPKWSVRMVVIVHVVVSDYAAMQPASMLIT